jgi:competence protein ComEA
VIVLGVRVVLADRGVPAGPVVPAVVGPAATAVATGTAGIGPGISASGGTATVAPSGAPPPGQPPTGGGVPGREPTPGTPTVTADASVSAGAASAGSGGGSVAGEVVVHVVGRVRHPGVVRLPGGSRVEQAVAAAGGARRDADLDRVNLARPLVDGEQVLVPRPGQPVEALDGTTGSVPLAPGGPGHGGFAGSGNGRPVQLVDVNTATLAELDTLPGVGPVLAQRILDWRAENGRFTVVDELGEVSGIGDAVLARLRPLVRM